MDLLEVEVLFSKLNEALKHGLPHVIFRFPKSNKITLWIQDSKELIYNNDFDSEGFVFAPFNLKDGVVLFPKKDSKIYQAEIIDLEVEKSSEVSLPEISESDKAFHISLVDFGIQFLNFSECQKVVLSREEKVEVKDFDAVSTYKRMLQKYENACVYMWSHSEVGTWMGASPERLLQFENNAVETTSLAGTQVYAEKLTWGTKEIEEQQIVTDYITEVLNDHVDAVQIEGPYTSKAGTLAHLKSVVAGKLKSDSTIKDIIEKLHPTPAVCGMPKQMSYDFLVTNENYNRSFYTGFFGELNFETATNLYVNLRCMKYHDGKVYIYIGGGITAASISEKEWEETVAKAKIMKAIL